MANYYHLAIAWDWEYDREFIALLEQRVQALGLRSYSISHFNTHETLRLIQKGELSFGAFLDRASDVDEHFAPVARALRKTGTLFVNPPDVMYHANDKATMHLEFLTKGLDVPFTIIISPFNKRKEVELTLSDLARLGRPFIIKPANTTGGGVGVILGAETLKDIIDSRQHNKNDKYLLQEKITPVLLDGYRAWFRVFYVYGLILPCWWNDETHIYTSFAPDDMNRYGLRPLIRNTRHIAEVCKLNFFSTEIALTDEGKFVIVDYVNDICDMRLQSRYPDGVPNEIVDRVCTRIALYLKRARKLGEIPS